MTIKTAPRFFVGKTKKKDGSPRYQVFRQRVTGRLIKKTVVEVFRKKWEPVKVKFARASKLFDTRAEARREKYEYEGKPQKKKTMQWPIAA